MNHTATSFIRRPLLANATFSALSGLIMIACCSSLGSLLGEIRSMDLLLLGIGLLFFASYLLFVAYRTPLVKRQIIAIIIMDLLWVIGSVLLLWLRPIALTETGQQLIILIAAIVACFALWQYRAIS